VPLGRTRRRRRRRRRRGRRRPLRRTSAGSGGGGGDPPLFLTLDPLMRTFTHYFQQAFKLSSILIVHPRRFILARANATTTIAHEHTLPLV
jgi:hypothetical protein